MVLQNIWYIGRQGVFVFHEQFPLSPSFNEFDKLFEIVRGTLEIMENRMAISGFLFY